MNKFPFALAALLCAGLVPTLAPRAVEAQTAQTVQAPSGYKQVLDAGKRNYQKEDYAAAAINAREMLRLAASTDEKADALTLFSESLYRGKNYAGAIEGWNLLLAFTRDDKEESNGALAEFGLGRTYSAQGDFAGAIPHLKAFANAIDHAAKISGNAEEAKALDAAKSLFALPLADAYYRTHQNELAKQQFESALPAGLVLPLILVPILPRTGQIDIEQGNYKRAQAEFQRTLSVFDVYRIGAQSDTEATTKPYIERRIAALKSIAVSPQTQGKRSASATANLQRDPKFDDKISLAIRLIADKFFVDSTFMDTLGE